MTAFGAWLFAMPGSSTAQQYALPADVPVMYRALVAFMLGVFAAMYAWMAAQSQANRPLLWLGTIGKGGAFLTTLALFLTGAVPAVTLGMMVGDALFSSIWLGWLLMAPKP